MRTANTLIRLGGCPGGSESSLGAHAILLGFVMRWRMPHTRRHRVKKYSQHSMASPWTIHVDPDQTPENPSDHGFLCLKQGV